MRAKTAKQLRRQDMADVRQPVFTITAKYYQDGTMDIDGFPTDITMAQNCVFGLIRVLWNYFSKESNEKEPQRIIRPTFVQGPMGRG